MCCIHVLCRMTQNLRLSGGRTLTSSDSNVTRNWSFPSTQLAGGRGTYTEPQLTISDNTSYGDYYNFCAASAGTVCDDNLTQNATQDICPRGWRLPAYGEQQGIRSYVSAFSPVFSGYYSGGLLLFVGSRGNWWASTLYSSLRHFYMFYRSDGLFTSGSSRSDELSIRCVRSS